MPQEQHIASFVKYNRNVLKMTQQQLAERSGVGLRFIRELEQGKETLRMDKVNQVLQLFGYTLAAKPQRILDPYEILLNHLNRNVRINLRNKTNLTGIIVEAINEGVEIKAWKFVSHNNAIEYRKSKKPESEQIINHIDIEDIEDI